MIKYLKIKNYMSHRESELNLSKGLNVIIGSNNCGKSALVSALQMLCRNNCGSNYCIRHGEKIAEVIVQTEEGDVCRWERKESQSPSYKINGKDFHRLRSDTPPDLDLLLKLPLINKGEDDEFEIHFASQKDPIFLLNQPGSKAAMFFASASDAGKLIDMQKKHQQNMKNSNRELNYHKKELEKITEDLERVNLIDILMQANDYCKEQYEIIEFRIKINNFFKNQILKLNELIINNQNNSKLVKIYKLLQSPPDLEKTKSLQVNINNFKNLNNKIKTFSIKRDILIYLEKPPQIHNDIKFLLEKIKNKLSLEKKEKNYFRMFVLLKQLNEVPIIINNKQLSTYINNFIVYEKKYNFFKKIEEVLSELTCPPSLIDNKILINAIDNLKKGQQKILESEQSSNKIKRDINNIKNEIEHFIITQKICPLCNSSLSWNCIKNEVTHV